MASEYHHRAPKPEPNGRHHALQHGPRTQSYMSSFQAHLLAASGEFVGTFFFLYFAYAAQVMLASQAGEASLSNGGTSSQTVIFTALIYGFSLLVNVWAFYRISGGLLNPAVSHNISSRHSIEDLC